MAIADTIAVDIRFVFRGERIIGVSRADITNIAHAIDIGIVLLWVSFIRTIIYCTDIISYTRIAKTITIGIGAGVALVTNTISISISLVMVGNGNAVIAYITD